MFRRQKGVPIPEESRFDRMSPEICTLAGEAPGDHDAPDRRVPLGGQRP